MPAEWLENLRATRRPARHDECQRIVRMPIRELPSQEEIDGASRAWVQPKAYEEGFRLQLAQARGILEFEKYGKLLGHLGVGSGKSLLGYMICSSCFATSRGRARILWLIPANLEKDFTSFHLEQGRRKLRVNNVPVTVLCGKTAERRKAHYQFARPGVYLVPYSLLSVPSTPALMAGINPDLVVSDEGHFLRNASARTKRFFDWAENREPEPLFVSMSGTLTNKSPMDYHRIAKVGLQGTSPLPLPRDQARVWATVLRSSAEAPNGPNGHAMAPLLEWARTSFPQRRAEFTRTTEGLRAAYELRLLSAEGYVSCGADEVGSSLLMERAPCDQPGPELAGHLKTLQDYGEHPSGDILQHGIEMFAAAQELSAGFYIRRFWPEPGEFTADQIDRARERWELNKTVCSLLREFFTRQRRPVPGLDTPLLVRRHMATEGPKKVPGALHEAWRQWREIDPLGLPERLAEPVRVDDYKLRAMLAWCKGKKGGVIWVRNIEIGAWACEVLRAAGLPVMAKGEGADWSMGDGSERFFCVASMCHAVGKNLQHFRHQLILQQPWNWEQLLGRLHRKGQEADCVVTSLLLPLTLDEMVLSSGIVDAIYSTETMGTQPKILTASWNPPPRIFRGAELRQVGFDSPALNEHKKRFLKERFGC